MNEDVLELATRIVRQANLAKVPADEELRTFFRKHPPVARRYGRELSQVVFRFYRWSRFANPKDSLPAKVRFANLRAEEFACNPSSFSLRALQLAIPKWLDKEMDTPYDWLSAIQSEPVLWIRTRIGSADKVRDELEISADAVGPYPEAMRYGGSEDLYRHPLFKSGELQIQDIASQLVGHLCAPQPKETWWDACAGEGGKTLHLSNLMDNKGLIWSTDRSKRRMSLLKKRAARAKAFNVRLREWDGGSNLPTKTQFDGVLIDAPCSGVGTWQRNPHARWSTTMSDVKELAEVQLRLLVNAARSVKRGGKLIYSVCTLTGRETTQVVAEFSKRFPEFEPLDLGYEGMAGERSPEIAIWPQDEGGNGMFVAGWKRKEQA
ncbi:MAG: RsmB/NOP family class I SAM-dependent RNA methyltransferase [Limisphaerales bacterium]